MDEPKKMGKVQAKQSTRENDAQVFSRAMALLNLMPSKHSDLFGATRQTVSKWMRGETSAPREAYVMLLDKVLDATAQRKANYAAAEQARFRAIEQARLYAEEQKRIKTASEEHIADALQRIATMGEKK